VIIGGSPQVVGGDPGGKRTARARREESIDGLFMGDTISEKSLDEVILAYLSDDAEE
jgi:hypothetical protein